MSEKNFNIINARVTFKNLPLHRLANFSFKDVLAASEAFKKISDVDECVILQNPFRIEIFLVTSQDKENTPDARRVEGKSLTINQIQKTWTSLTELDQYELDHFDQTIEVYKADNVYLHLLRLASGLDSIVVGREGILDEIKETIANAKKANLSGNILNNLFDNCINSAIKIRESTEISKGITSLGDIALKTIQDKTGIDGKKVLLIGTGEIAAMVARALGHKEIAYDVTSMTIERATSFGSIFGGTPIKFEDVLLGFDKYDIIIVATTSDYILISYDRIKRIMQKKKKGTMILDVSFPRAVANEVSTLPGVKLMFRDQIDELYEEYINSSQKKIPAVEELINKEVPTISATIK